MAEAKQPNFRLRFARKQRHMTQKELAEKIGVSPITVNRWENGQNKPDFYAIERLVEVLGRSEEELGLIDVPVSASQALYQSDMDVLSPEPQTFSQMPDKVDAIYRMISKQSVNAAVIYGVAGVGKSTLATMLFEHARIVRQTNAGPFQIEEHLLTIEPATTFAELGERILSLCRIPSPGLYHLLPKYQAKAFFSSLCLDQDQPRLIVLDQFENLLDNRSAVGRAGVLAWLRLLASMPCPTHFVLTSRLNFAGSLSSSTSALHFYPLDGLTISAGIQLLRLRGVGTVVPDEVLRAVVERCKGHALSLVILAALIRLHGGTLQMVLEDASFEQAWTDQIAHTLLERLNIQRFPLAQRNVLLALSIYREAVPYQAISVIYPEQTYIQTLHALTALRKHHLVEANNGRYLLHASIAAFARTQFAPYDETMNAQLLREAHIRASRFYQQHRGTRAQTQHKPSHDSIHTAIEIFWHLCQAEQWEKAFQTLHHEQIYTDYHHQQGRNAVLVELYEMLVPLEKWNPSFTERALFFEERGRIYHKLSNNQAAYANYRELVDASEQAQRPDVLCRGLQYMGAALDDMGRKSEAHEAYQRAYEIAVRCDNRHIQAIALTRLAWILSEDSEGHEATDDEKKQAEAMCSQSIDILKQLLKKKPRDRDLRRSLADAYGFLGWVYERSCLPMQARTSFMQAFHIFQSLEERIEEAWMICTTAITYVETGEIDEAMQRYHAALAVFCQTRHRRGEGWTLWRLVGIMQRPEQLSEALLLAERAWMIFHEDVDEVGAKCAYETLECIAHKLLCLILESECRRRWVG